ncbi:hypothetical protein IU436_29345 [Nocardia farcinica]|nr:MULTISPECIES: hypothetical protein [Nocardia]MBF6216331.1 hypothetical protein [Nocardia puris]MBF6422721.1 hypothetical protein [Nocardia farcinica]MBF6434429.1 hypothetical protein [Nocardia farcinica]
MPVLVLNPVSVGASTAGDALVVAALDAVVVPGMIGVASPRWVSSLLPQLASANTAATAATVLSTRIL